LRGSYAFIQEIKTHAFDSALIVYFYFDFSDVTKQTIQDLATSVIYQIAEGLSKIPEPLIALYERCENGKAQPPLKDLCQAAVDICSTSTSEVYLVIDALDECSRSDRSDLLAFIKRLASCKQLRLFVTSQREPDIAAGLGTMDLDTIDLAESRVDPDILVYIRNRLREDSSIDFKWGPDGKKMIEEALVKGAKGG
jgi:hypothetical protein